MGEGEKRNLPQLPIWELRPSHSGIGLNIQLISKSSVHADTIQLHAGSARKGTSSTIGKLNLPELRTAKAVERGKLRLIIKELEGEAIAIVQDTISIYMGGVRESGDFDGFRLAT